MEAGKLFRAFKTTLTRLYIVAMLQPDILHVEHLFVVFGLKN